MTPLLGAKHRLCYQVFDAHVLWFAHHFLDIDLLVYLKCLVDLVRWIRVVFNPVDLHQVHANGSPERLSVHVYVAVASLSHLECILGLSVDSIR